MSNQAAQAPIGAERVVDKKQSSGRDPAILDDQNSSDWSPFSGLYFVNSYSEAFRSDTAEAAAWGNKLPEPGLSTEEDERGSVFQSSMTDSVGPTTLPSSSVSVRNSEDPDSSSGILASELQQQDEPANDTVARGRPPPPFLRARTQSALPVGAGAVKRQLSMRSTGAKDAIRRHTVIVPDDNTAAAMRAIADDQMDDNPFSDVDGSRPVSATSASECDGVKTPRTSAMRPGGSTPASPSRTSIMTAMTAAFSLSEQPLDVIQSDSGEDEERAAGSESPGPCPGASPASPSETTRRKVSSLADALISPERSPAVVAVPSNSQGVRQLQTTAETSSSTASSTATTAPACVATRMTGAAVLAQALTGAANDARASPGADSGCTTPGSVAIGGASASGMRSPHTPASTTSTSGTSTGAATSSAGQTQYSRHAPPIHPSRSQSWGTRQGHLFREQPSKAQHSLQRGLLFAGESTRSLDIGGSENSTSISPWQPPDTPPLGTTAIGTSAATIASRSQRAPPPPPPPPPPGPQGQQQAPPHAHMQFMANKSASARSVRSGRRLLQGEGGEGGSAPFAAEAPAAVARSHTPGYEAHYENQRHIHGEYQYLLIRQQTQAGRGGYAWSPNHHQHQQFAYTQQQYAHRQQQQLYQQQGTLQQQQQSARGSDSYALPFYTSPIGAASPMERTDFDATPSSTNSGPHRFQQHAHDHMSPGMWSAPTSGGAGGQSTAGSPDSEVSWAGFVSGAGSEGSTGPNGATVVGKRLLHGVATAPLQIHDGSQRGWMTLEPPAFTQNLHDMTDNEVPSETKRNKGSTAPHPPGRSIPHPTPVPQAHMDDPSYHEPLLPSRSSTSCSAGTSHQFAAGGVSSGMGMTAGRAFGSPWTASPSDQMEDFPAHIMDANTPPNDGTGSGRAGAHTPQGGGYSVSRMTASAPSFGPDYTHSAEPQAPIAMPATRAGTGTPTGFAVAPGAMYPMYAAVPAASGAHMIAAPYVMSGAGGGGASSNSRHGAGSRASGGRAKGNKPVTVWTKRQQKKILFVKSTAASSTTSSSQSQGKATAKTKTNSSNSNSSSNNKHSQPTSRS